MDRQLVFIVRVIRTKRFWAGLILAGILLSGIIGIFSMSRMDASSSNALSKSVTAAIEKWTGQHFRIQPEDRFWRKDLNNIVRKAGHVIEYFLLGMVMCSFINVLTRRNGISMVLSLLFCMIVAWIDESLQYFTPGRGPQIQDVLLDTGAALIGVILSGVVLGTYWHVQGLKRRIRKLELQCEPFLTKEDQKTI